jgi:hypothetical protein
MNELKKSADKLDVIFCVGGAGFSFYFEVITE